MNINIKTTNITLTDSISDYTSKRLEAVKQLLANDSTIRCDVELGKTSAHHKNGDISRSTWSATKSSARCVPQKIEKFLSFDVVEQRSRGC